MASMRKTNYLFTLIVLSAVLLLPQASAFSVTETVARLFAPENIAKHYLELLGLACVILYIITGVVGAAKNKEIATSWFSVLGEPDGVLDRNFAVHHGLKTSSSGKELWWKDSPDTFKTYASGRRYCTGALLTLNLKARQDVFSRLWYLLSPRDDYVEVDVFMSETVMPQTVMCLGQPKVVRALLKDDISKLGSFAKIMQVAKERVPGGWSNERMAVAAEAPSMFYDILNAEPSLAKALSSSRLLRSVVVSSEVLPGANPASSKVSFTIALPQLSQADEISSLLSCLFLLVDLLGSYKMSPELRKRAGELRTKLQVEEVKKVSQDRQEQLQQKRMEKIEAERAKARAAGPAALAKFEEKLQQKYRQREMRKRMIRG